VTAADPERTLAEIVGLHHFLFQRADFDDAVAHTFLWAYKAATATGEKTPLDTVSLLDVAYTTATEQLRDDHDFRQKLADADNYVDYTKRLVKAIRRVGEPLVGSAPAALLCHPAVKPLMSDALQRHCGYELATVIGAIQDTLSSYTLDEQDGWEIGLAIDGRDLDGDILELLATCASIAAAVDLGDPTDLPNDTATFLRRHGLVDPGDGPIASSILEFGTHLYLLPTANLYRNLLSDSVFARQQTTPTNAIDAAVETAAHDILSIALSPIRGAADWPAVTLVARHDTDPNGESDSLLTADTFTIVCETKAGFFDFSRHEAKDLANAANRQLPRLLQAATEGREFTSRGTQITEELRTAMSNPYVIPIICTHDIHLTSLTFSAAWLKADTGHDGASIPFDRWPPVVVSVTELITLTAHLQPADLLAYLRQLIARSNAHRRRNVTNIPAPEHLADSVARFVTGTTSVRYQDPNQVPDDLAHVALGIADLLGGRELPDLPHIWRDFSATQTIYQIDDALHDHQPDGWLAAATTLRMYDHHEILDIEQQLTTGAVAASGPISYDDTALAISVARNTSQSSANAAARLVTARVPHTRHGIAILTNPNYTRIRVGHYDAGFVTGGTLPLPKATQ
jgi:hypothetical protein